MYKVLWMNFLNQSVLSQVFPEQFMNFHTWSQSTGTLNSGFFQAVWEWWSKVYSIIIVAVFSGGGLFVYCMFLEVKYWSPDSCTLIPFHNQKCKLPVSHDFSHTMDVVSVAYTMNGLKNLISPAANSFDRSEENEVFLYPGHLQVSSKICIVSTSFQMSLVIKGGWFITLVKGEEVQKKEVTRNTNSVCDSDCKYYGFLSFFHSSQKIYSQRDCIS